MSAWKMLSLGVNFAKLKAMCKESFVITRMWQFWEQAELLALPCKSFVIYCKSIGQKLHSGSPTKRNVIYRYKYLSRKKVYLYARSKLVVIIITSNRYTLTDAEICYVKC